MNLAYHAPGDRLDAHNLDPDAHGGVFLKTSDIAGPTIITPPGAVIAASGAAAWYTANAATFMRFHVPAARTYRYVNLHVGTQSGNIQAGVSALTPDGASSINATRVAHSGVIACPAAGAQRIDIGATTLTPGDYALFLWCDNTTAQFLHSLASGLQASRLLFTGTVPGGIPSGVLTLGATARWVTGLTLEAA